MPRTAAFDVMGTLFDLKPVEERFGAETMPRLLHTALSLQAAGLRAIHVDRGGAGWRLPLPEDERYGDLVAAAEAAAT